MTIDDVMQAAPVIPVLVIEDAGHAEPLARALVAGGLPVLEVTLRTPAALDVIRAMRAVPGAIVGAGTVLNADDYARAVDSGAQFIVSPGLTEPLGKYAQGSSVPFLPGVANAGDIMRGLDLGLDRFKFFPAMTSGGLAALKSLAGPFGAVRFCPTGGITQDSAGEWLAHPAVTCVGGSWLVRPNETDWSAIEDRARAAAALRP